MSSTTMTARDIDPKDKSWLQREARAGRHARGNGGESRACDCLAKRA